MLKGIGAIRIRMPIERKRSFRSDVVPHHEQIDPRLKEDMAALHLAGISTRTLAMMSRRILGIDVSHDTVSKSLHHIEDEALRYAVTARCWVHAMMNAMAKTPQRFRPTFKKLADDVMYARGEDDARKAFLKLKSVMANDATRAVACLEKDLDSLVAHYAFHPSLWRALKTTNAIERVHREFKRRTKSMDSLGERTLQVVVAFTAIRMEFNWQKIPVDSKVINNFLYVKKHFLDMPTDLNIN